MSLLTYNWQEPDFTGLISNALHGEEQQRLQAMQQAEQQRLAMKQAGDLALQLRQEARMAGAERFRQELEGAREGRQQEAADSLIAHRKAEDAYKYGPGRNVDLSGLLTGGTGGGSPGVTSGGVGSDITGRYSYDPDTGALITPVSSFGHLPDVTTGQDDGLFAGGKNGASVLKADGTPITEADLADVRAHPERYRDNPEPYAAFPKAMYDSGAVKPGEKYWVSAPGKDGEEHWAQIVARDFGPSAKNRGLDVNPSVLDALGVGTDAKVRVYVPGAENIVRGGGAPAGGGAVPEVGVIAHNFDAAARQRLDDTAAAVKAGVMPPSEWATQYQNELRNAGINSAPAAGGGTPDFSGAIRNMSPAQQDAAVRDLLRKRASGASVPKVKDSFRDADGNLYVQMTDGTWQGGRAAPSGSTKVGTGQRAQMEYLPDGNVRVGTIMYRYNDAGELEKIGVSKGGQESEAKLTVMYSRAQNEEKQAQAELDAMRKEEEAKSSGDVTQGYPWPEGGKMYRVDGDGKRQEVKTQKEYDDLVARANKAQRWTQTVKRAQQQQEEIWGKMNGAPPPAAAAPKSDDAQTLTPTSTPAPAPTPGPQDLRPTGPSKVTGIRPVPPAAGDKYPVGATAMKDGKKYVKTANGWQPM